MVCILGNTPTVWGNISQYHLEKKDKKVENKKQENVKEK
jgi:hypothetical protein